VSELPDWLQPVRVLSPLWHGVELCRAATTGTGDALALLGSVVFLGALVALGSAWGIRAFSRKLAS
jgi:lipooligosaccharide transport system permease protein